jgi:bifunctional UDP-N-acetylglucosamine pyrophosphorylase / glucosamine-1-phosphate N-acetyltransferase
MNRALAAVVMAAGKGTRMRSDLPKVLHPLAGRPILEHVLGCLNTLTLRREIVIIGYGADQVRKTLQRPNLEFVEQIEQKGTGHAVQQVLPVLADFEGDVLIINGDAPLLLPETLKRLVDGHRNSGAGATILSAVLEDPFGYGRVFCDDQGFVERVIEHKDCSDAQRLNPRVNVGVYCFDWLQLAKVLPDLTADNAQGELYLPDTLTKLKLVGHVAVADVAEVFGINDRVQLAQAEHILKERTLQRVMLSGVTIVDPASVSIDDTVEIAQDVIIEPQTHLRGKTRIASGCRLGPGSLVENSDIGADVEVLYSVVRDTIIGARTVVGPYAHLRNGASIGSDCRVGNFVEVKNAQLGDGTKAGHLSYLGDARLGENVNVGAGTITANFDGKKKNFTEIGARSKTGANSVLVPPIKIGENVVIGAGSTITEDVPDNALVIARARQVVKPDRNLDG